MNCILILYIRLAIIENVGSGNNTDGSMPYLNLDGQLSNII